ncbi:hypothetical protein NLJ89_g9965 [Agrocybe chaxingu]|uniref:Uncharacterized protein n=1 Tax=Agrocybe chaxingu TaxID=84603 RepID=A0A9W8JS79_9AGAR|nr:hypothetical protein NLJ89_g9965 [Agrocybe chaxingu]
MSSIKITYALNPPADLPSPAPSDLPRQKSHEYKVDAPQDDKKAFYAALRTSLEAARNEVGDELTKWRDVVGKAELRKEPKKVMDEEGEEEEEEEEEQT